MAARRPNFWQNSGYGLLKQDANGHLTVTDDFLRAYFNRPEVAPVEESCQKERALHAELLETPKRPVSKDEIAALEDPDGRDNYQVLIDFRDRLIDAGTVEACYLNLFRDGDVRTAPLFLDQMAQVITRAVLDGTDDPFRARAGELMFREQTVTIHEGSILSGDLETVEMLAQSGGMGAIGTLLVEGGIKPRQVDLDVMQQENAHKYWQRDERHDMVLDLSFTRPGLDALSRVMEGWIDHFTGAAVSIQPVQKITDEKWVWHIGLDPDASAILNDLYDGNDVDEDRMERLLTLFRLEFKDDSLMLPDIAGRPVYMGLAMTEKKRLKLKPQNLLVNLPLAPEA
ncbi:MAG: hypothetical protein JJ855_06290 [Rhodospirillales bacterium]|nr:hypothetical protein [Rhodospirillales bacterium]